MDTNERAELDEAIVAHCKWLEQRGLEIPAKPEDLEAWQLFSQQWLVPRVDQFVATAVLSNLAALVAFRTRRQISVTRVRLLEGARARISAASPGEKATARRRAAMVAWAMDETYIRELMQPLQTALARVRTLQNATERYVVALKKRHKKAASLGLRSVSLADLALGRWIQSHSRRFEADLTFFAGQLPGREVVPHTGPTTAKAWHQLRGECLLRLKEAKVSRALMRELLPPGRAWSGEAERSKEEKKRRGARDDKSIARARKRRGSEAKALPGHGKD